MRTEREAVRLRRAMTVGTVRRILDGSFLFVPLIRVFARTGKPQRVEKLIGQPRSWKPNPPGASSVCPHPCVRVRVSAFLSRCSRLFVRVPPSVCRPAAVRKWGVRSAAVVRKWGARSAAAVRKCVRTIRDGRASGGAGRSGHQNPIRSEISVPRRAARSARGCCAGSIARDAGIPGRRLVSVRCGFEQKGNSGSLSTCFYIRSAFDELRIRRLR